MRNSHRILATLALVWLLMASAAMAGGQPATKIKFKNRSAVPVAVGVDNPVQTIQQFIYLGGKYVNPGNSKEFKVSAGTHRVYLVDALNPVFPAITLDVDVRKKKTVTVVFENGVLVED
jgi:hypothetical protein